VVSKSSKTKFPKMSLRCKFYNVESGHSSGEVSVFYSDSTFELTVSCVCVMAATNPGSQHNAIILPQACVCSNLLMYMTQGEPNVVARLYVTS